MKRISITVIAIITLATAIAQLQSRFPASVQMFLLDQKEGFFKQTSPMRGIDDSKRSAYAPPYQMNGVEVVDAFIDIANPGVIESLKAVGVIVNCEFDGFITAQIPVDLLKTVSAMDGVTDVEISKMLEFCTDSTLSVTHAGEVLNGTGFGLPQAYDGSGVIIGVIDAGFDYQHIAFKRADNDSVTRIVRVYDPNDTTGHPAIVGTNVLKGSILMGEQIDALTTDMSGGSHGTHTTSIAAGRPVEGYSGMAPGADIVLCTSRTLNTGITETQVANCIKYIYAYADSVGKPCVISVSVSHNSGQHDGTDRICKAVAQCTGPGRIFVISAGNTGNSDNYCSGSATMDRPLNMLYGYLTDNCDEACYYKYLWSDTWVRMKSTRPVARFHILDKFDKRIVWESEPTSLTMMIDASEISDYFEADLSMDTVGYLYTMVSITNVAKYNIVTRIRNLRCKETIYNAEEDKTYGRYQIGLSIYPPKVMYPNMTDSIYLDSWVGSSQSILTPYTDEILVNAISEDGDTILSPVSNYYTIANNDASIITYAANDSIISAGAYVARNSHYSLNYNMMIYNNSVTLNDACSFSGYEPEGAGPTGKALPTITAPGLWVIAAGSRYSFFQNDITKDVVLRKDGFPYGVMTGTSMAAPTVAGIIAQWLQINPNLSPGNVKHILAETAIKDNFTSTNPRFGPNGKIDAMAGARYLLGITDDPEPPLVLGDINGNGIVNLDDLTKMILYLVYGDSTGLDLDAGDINRNGGIDLNDLTLLINFLVYGHF
mgnify:CR=1 FL=1